MRLNRVVGDTGEADPAVLAVLASYASGDATEHAVLTAVAASRLLVPVVAVLAEVNADGTDNDDTEKETEMALPTLVGNDGRKAVIAFSGMSALRSWRADARPVPVPAPRLWSAAVAEADAVVVDIAGPVPLVIEGERLRALANGEPPPHPHEDPDIRALVAEVLAEVGADVGAGFALGPGGPAADLVIVLPAADMATARAVAGQLASRLRPRLRRGIEIRTASR